MTIEISHKSEYNRCKLWGKCRMGIASNRVGGKASGRDISYRREMVCKKEGKGC